MQCYGYGYKDNNSDDMKKFSNKKSKDNFNDATPLFPI